MQTSLVIKQWISKTLKTEFFTLKSSTIFSCSKSTSFTLLNFERSENVQFLHKWLIVPLLLKWYEHIFWPIKHLQYYHKWFISLRIWWLHIFRLLSTSSSQTKVFFAAFLVFAMSGKGSNFLGFESSYLTSMSKTSFVQFKATSVLSQYLKICNLVIKTCNLGFQMQVLS